MDYDLQVLKYGLQVMESSHEKKGKGEHMNLPSSRATDAFRSRPPFQLFAYTQLLLISEGKALHAQEQNIREND